MAISRSQMGSQLVGNRVSTGDDAKDLELIRMGKGCLLYTSDAADE